MQGKYQAGKGLAEAHLDFDETKPTIATLRRLFRRVFPVPYENCEIGGPRSVYQGFPSLVRDGEPVGPRKLSLMGKALGDAYICIQNT